MKITYLVLLVFLSSCSKEAVSLELFDDRRLTMEELKSLGFKEVLGIDELVMSHTVEDTTYNYQFNSYAGEELCCLFWVIDSDFDYEEQLFQFLDDFDISLLDFTSLEDRFEMRLGGNILDGFFDENNNLVIGFNFK